MFTVEIEETGGTAAIDLATGCERRLNELRVAIWHVTGSRCASHSVSAMGLICPSFATRGSSVLYVQVTGVAAIADIFRQFPSICPNSIRTSCCHAPEPLSLDPVSLGLNRLAWTMGSPRNRGSCLKCGAVTRTWPTKVELRVLSSFAAGC